MLVEKALSILLPRQHYFCIGCRHMHVYRCGFRDLVEELKEMVVHTLGTRLDHGYPHVERVWRLAYEITDSTGVDVDYCVLDFSVLLHDIGRAVGEPHAYFSALIAKSLLLERGFREDFVDKVVNSILYHSYSYVKQHGVKPVCEEAKILSDADKLDALGTIGFIRVFLYDPYRDLKDVLKHINEKILKLPDLMHYDYTKRKAYELRDRLVKMTGWLLEEIGTDPATPSM